MSTIHNGRVMLLVLTEGTWHLERRQDCVETVEQAQTGLQLRELLGKEFPLFANK